MPTSSHYGNHLISIDIGSMTYVEVSVNNMLETYVDYVLCTVSEQNVPKAEIHFSTEHGDKVVLNVEEEGLTMAELVSKYLDRYMRGLYSSSEHKFVALDDYADYEGSLEGYVSYRLNYRPEYVERVFEHYDESESGYKIGSLNPIYGDKIKCTWTDMEYMIENDGSYFIQFALYDDFGSFMDIYVDWPHEADLHQCVLKAVKEASETFCYWLEEGVWSVHEEDMDHSGTYYDIDLEYDEAELLALEFDEEADD